MKTLLLMKFTVQIQIATVLYCYSQTVRYDKIFPEISSDNAYIKKIDNMHHAF